MNTRNIFIRGEMRKKYVDTRSYLELCYFTQSVLDGG